MDVALKFAAEIVRLHGIPRSIVSDRDKHFLSQVWRDLFSISGTKLKYSTAYHPQTDGQTENLNRTLESYLRCFSSAKPKSWNKFLSWAELWYNTSYHSAIKTTPFNIVYGRDPPPLLRFEVGSTKNFALEQELLARDQALRILKDNLLKAQQVMKTSADKHRRHLEFTEGQLVYLKLRPYRQNSVATRLSKKLSAKYFGPFKILQRIGKVAYRLQLPQGTKIHDVFHVSLLKAAVGRTEPVETLPTTLLSSEELTIEPESIRDTRYNSTGHLEALVRWKGFSEEDDEWVNARTLLQQHPSLELEDKSPLKGGSIDKPFRVYFRKNQRANGRNRSVRVNESSNSVTLEQKEPLELGDKEVTEDKTSTNEVRRELKDKEIAMTEASKHSTGAVAERRELAGQVCG